MKRQLYSLTKWMLPIALLVSFWHSGTLAKSASKAKPKSKTKTISSSAVVRPSPGSRYSLLRVKPALARKYLREARELAAAMETEMKRAGKKGASFFLLGLSEAYADDGAAYMCMNNMYYYDSQTSTDCNSANSRNWNLGFDLAAKGFSSATNATCGGRSGANPCSPFLAGFNGNAAICSNNNSGNCVTPEGLAWLQSVQAACGGSPPSDAILKRVGYNSGCEAFSSEQSQQIAGLVNVCNNTSNSALRGGRTCARVKSLASNIESNTITNTLAGAAAPSSPGRTAAAAGAEPAAESNTENEYYGGTRPDQSEGVAQLCSDVVHSKANAGRLSVTSNFGYQNSGDGAARPVMFMDIDLPNNAGKSKLEIFPENQKTITGAFATVWCYKNNGREKVCLKQAPRNQAGQNPDQWERTFRVGTDATERVVMRNSGGNLTVKFESEGDTAMMGTASNGLIVAGVKPSVTHQATYTIKPSNWGEVAYDPNDSNKNRDSWESYEVGLKSDSTDLDGRNFSQTELNKAIQAEIGRLDADLNRIVRENEQAIQFYNEVQPFMQKITLDELNKDLNGHVEMALQNLKRLRADALNKGATVAQNERVVELLDARMATLRTLQKSPCSQSKCPDSSKNLDEWMERVRKLKADYRPSIARTTVTSSEGLDAAGTLFQSRTTTTQDPNNFNDFDSDFTKTISCPASTNTIYRPLHSPLPVPNGEPKQDHPSTPIAI